MDKNLENSAWSGSKRIVSEDRFSFIRQCLPEHQRLDLSGILLHDSPDSERFNEVLFLKNTDN
jgi:hypothetical protein